MKPITVVYRNYKGETKQRSVVPMGVRFGTTEWHPEPGWLLQVFDVEKQEGREFALADCNFTTPVMSDAALADLLMYEITESDGSVRIIHRVPHRDEIATAIRVVRVFSDGGRNTIMERWSGLFDGKSLP